MLPTKVLIVDDDPESRSLLSEVLGANGYSSLAVADGLAARELLQHNQEFQIVVADLRMPNESGLDLLRNLREQNSKHEVILMSSFMSGGEKAALKALGAHFLLEKPFKLAELLEMVAELAAHNSVGTLS